MPSFFFAFLAALLIGQGARDQLLVARMARETGRGILLAGWSAAILSATGMAWAGAVIAQILPTSGRHMLVAFALLAAAAELAWPNREKAMSVPTYSTFAGFLVLLSRQLGDASRFVIFALAAATALPGLSAVGGALGGGAALTFGWVLGERLAEDVPLRCIRLGLAAITFIAGIVIALTARGIVN